MIICIDIGNTNIKYAIYEGERLRISFRVATDLKKTSDEYGSQLVNMLKVMEIKPRELSGGIVSSVVPTLDYTVDKMCGLYLGIKPLHIEPGLKSGLNIRCDDAREVGADRIVNCVSAIVRYGENKPLIVVDFGTATTFNIISADNEFIGGVISPGIKGSLDSSSTARRNCRGWKSRRRKALSQKTPSPICRRDSYSGLRGWWSISSPVSRKNSGARTSRRLRRGASARSFPRKCPVSTSWISF